MDDDRVRMEAEQPIIVTATDAAGGGALGKLYTHLDFAKPRKQTRQAKIQSNSTASGAMDIAYNHSTVSLLQAIINWLSKERNLATLLLTKPKLDYVKTENHHDE